MVMVPPITDGFGPAKITETWLVAAWMSELSIVVEKLVRPSCEAPAKVGLRSYMLTSYDCPACVPPTTA